MSLAAAEGVIYAGGVALTGDVLLEANTDALSDTLAKIPDIGFINRPVQRRRALNNKISAIAEKIEAEEYQEAKQKLENDLLRTVERWVKDEYDVGSGEATKQDLIDAIENLIDELETLVQEN
ncbi:hypothetical protein AUR66_11510 [Haloferax profundi]|uniref:Uncharacterized protein n=1 Tax=Haloferax profundi TaxID=1544718 RepID=A0A0W1SR15_9EURY|nr:hypothetical protein AUR66_11510 [Haloferax profundi]